MARHPIYQNASLLRELRMIAQVFTRSRENEAFWGRNKAEPKAPTQRLWCVVCLRNPGTNLSPMPAVTISKGDAVCNQHFHA